MPRSGCSALHGVNRNLKKKKKNCHNPKTIKYLSRIRLGLSHLSEDKYKHSFQDTLNPVCPCESDIETPCYYLISCPIFDAE